MTITANDAFKSAPRISRDGFARLIAMRAAASVIAERDVVAYYDAIVATGVDPLLIAAIFQHESQMGRAGVAVTTHSWGNTRSPSFGATPIGEVPGRTGTFPVFRDWLDGAKSTAARLATPEWVYSGQSRNAKTKQTFGPRTAIREIFDHPSEQVWAPAGDLNDPEGYLRSVLDFMNQYADQGGAPMPTDKPRVALAAGHHNTSGGDATEHAQTGELTPAIAKALRARGFEVRVITPDDGRGDYPGSLSAVASQVTADDDCFLEVHTEGVGNPNVRGVFAIYPDWGDDVDTDVRDTLGPAIAKAVSAATGLPVRGSGVMSEKQTGVGAGGDRLGVFGATARYKATCTRLIVEYGSHTSPADMALWKQPAFLSQAADATADALAAFYGLAVPPKEPQGPSPTDSVALRDGNPHGPYGYRLGFRAHVLKVGAAVYPQNPELGALAVFGWATDSEYVGADGHTYQPTERYLLEYIPGNQPPWDVVGVLRGAPVPQPKAA